MVARICRLLLPLMLVGCHKVRPLHEPYTAMLDDFEAADVDQWAKECAPRELALAQSHRSFAELEFEQGDARRAEEHLDIAIENIAIAVQKADECRPKDRDGDGIWDHEDQCPDDPEDMDGHEDEDGCPDLDRDRDGITDADDVCPDDPEDIDGFRDADGCPDLDNDNDGLVDRVDKCPNEAEDLNGFEDEDGCPEGVIDRDGDGIVDNVDQCPDEPENKNEYLDEDGCPDVKPQNVTITKERIEIHQKILFASGKAKILRSSWPILDSVAQVMKDYPAITVRIEGHTDSDGSDTLNQRLSDQRAAAVQEYLGGKGVEAKRLSSKGYGETQPIDTNRTSTGKANNRRVEFHIVDGM